MKLYLRTFGCRANQYDTEAVRAMALASGAEIVDAPDLADVALFNSCAVTAEAEADLRQQVRRAARVNPRLRSVVMGCAAALPQHGRASAILDLPSVTHAIAGADLDAVSRALELEVRPRTQTAAQRGARALLRIQDGCDEHCTFCATTLARGRNRSRAITDVVEEASVLSQHHSEIVLTGVHIGTYGADTGASLGELVERLIAAAPTVRFRLSSVEATEVDERLRILLTSAPRHLAPYLHAPLQSGSDRVLRRMGRHWYSAAEYARAVHTLVERSPVFGLGADVITGFPGETDEDHRATRELIESLPFTSLHVFPYSARPGTAAVRLPGSVPPVVARDRARELRAIAETKAAVYRARRAGGVADVVVIREGEDGEGLTEDYLSVRLTEGRRGERFTARLAVDAGSLLATRGSELRTRTHDSRHTTHDSAES